MGSLSFTDRCTYALIGAVFGAAYGAVIALIAMAIYGAWNIAYVGATALVFGALAFVIGPFIGDAIAGVLHLVSGVIWGIRWVEWWPERPPPGAVPRIGFLAALFWFGFATAVAIYLALHIWR